MQQRVAHAIATLTDLVASGSIRRKLQKLIEILYHGGKLLLLDVSVGEDKVDVGIIGLQRFGL